MRVALCLVAGAFVAACSKGSTEATPAPSASAPVASSSAAPSASAAAPSASAGVSSSWKGTYKSAAATLTVGADWKKVHWSDTQSTDGVGDGTLTLAVDGATGHATGTVDGPLGPATIDGVVAEGKLSAAVRRKDPSDHGFTGTLLGSVTGDHAEGTMNVSLGTANALRTATFVLSPGAAH
jgi:hypothetical protein